MSTSTSSPSVRQVSGGTSAVDLASAGSLTASPGSTSAPLNLSGEADIPQNNDYQGLQRDSPCAPTPNATIDADLEALLQAASVVQPPPTLGAEGIPTELESTPFPPSTGLEDVSAATRPPPSPSTEFLGRLSPIARSLSLAPHIPLSFANVATLASTSTSAACPPYRNSPLHIGTPSLTALHSPIPSTSHSEGPGDSSVAFAQNLATSLQRRATDGASMPKDNTRIQAFAKLEFPSFDIYIQKLSVTIGRRPAPPSPQPSPAPSNALAEPGSQLADYIMGLSHPATEQEEPHTLPEFEYKPSVKGKEKALEVPPASLFSPLSPTPPTPSAIANPTIPSVSLPCSSGLLEHVPFASTSAAGLTGIPITSIDSSTNTDVDLGPIRAVSRQHAKLYFDYDAGAWAIEVLGRNGVVVEGKWRAKGQRVLLTKKTKLQIAERIFYFVLPNVEGETKQSPGKKSKSLEKRKMRTRSRGGVGIDDPSTSSAASDSESGRVNGLSTSGRAVSAIPGLQPRSLLPSLPPPATGAPGSPASARSPSFIRSPDLSLIPLGHPDKMPVTRGSMKPKPPPPVPKVHRTPAPPPEEPDEYALELGRQRAAIIAQILSGRLSAASGQSALVAAAAQVALEQRKSGGRGKSKAPPPAGKGPGKGKGLPPRPRRPSTASWDDYEGQLAQSDDSRSSSSDDSDDSDMDVDDPTGGGKFLRKTPAKTPLKTPAKTPVDAGPSSSLPSSAPPAPSVPQKQPAKQLKKHRGPLESTLAAPSSSTSTTQQTASPLSGALPALPGLSSSLPALPPSAAAVSPALSSSSSLRTPLLPAATLPSLPLLPPGSSGPSPAASASSLPPLSSAGQMTAAVPRAASLPRLPTPAVSSNAGSPPIQSPLPVGSSLPLHAKKPKTAQKPKAPSASPEKSAIGASGAAATAAKPRPAPYTPATLALGAVPPDAAPSDDRIAKPPYTYASLIAQAIQASEGKKLTHSAICDWISEKWPFFVDGQSGWQTSIRHHLTPARGFLKVARPADDAGTSSFWQLDPAQLPNFDGHYFQVKKFEGVTTASSKSPHAGSASPAPSTSSPGLSANKAVIPSSASSASTSARPSPSPAASSAAATVASNPALAKPLPIIVAPIPESYIRPAPPTGKSQPTDELTASLLKDPPIVLHEGQLILNPTIFAHLTKEEIQTMESNPASQALQKLQAFVVQHFKEKMRKAAAEKAKAAKGKKKKKATTDASSAGKAGNATASTSTAPPPTTAATAPSPATSALPKPPPPSVNTVSPIVAPSAGIANSASTKRARQADIDLASAPAAKVAKTAAKKK
ncbi:hypothetical protein JCM11641_004250 [Rhodosporidiobolus odoratus]